MRGPNVQDWVQNYIDDNFSEQADDWKVTWAMFKQHLNNSFLDKGRTLLAQEKLEIIQQGPDTADDFFKKFEILLNDAGYQKDSPFVIRLIEKAVNGKTIDQIYGSRKTRIEKYDEYKDTIISIDEMWRRRQEQKKARPWSTWWGRDTQKTNSTKTNTPPPPPPPATADRRDGTGIIFGGAGRPMDLDKARAERRCFTCGQKGHISRYCPHKGQTVVRQTIVEDTGTSNQRPAGAATIIRQAFMGLGNEERAALARELGFVLPPQ